MTQSVPSLNDLDMKRIQSDFPGIQDIHFLDTAASAQKPLAVIQAMENVHTQHYANVHRGIYSHSQKTTEMFEAARRKVAGFLNAPSDNEIVFTRNTTEAINLVAATWGRENLGQGDVVILTELEHHANIVPWTLLRDQKGFTIKVAPILPDGSLDQSAYAQFLNEGNVKLVSLIHMSNALGVINSVAEMTAQAKAARATVLIDASQSAVHMPVDAQSIGCDFLVFTGHKVYGPTGIGVLWGKEDILNAMPPYQGGGEMIEKVSFEAVTFKSAPARFEAGTPAIVEAIGLGAAIDYLAQFDIEAVQAHEKQLLDTATQALSAIDGVTIYGTTENKASVLSFNIGDIHPHDVGTVFDQMNVAVRAGHHCCQPLMKALGVSATVRASFGLYNTMDDVDALVKAVHKVKSIFGG